MFTKILDALLDRAQTMDFWRGVLYAAAAAGVAIDPANAAAIISSALAISGVAHMMWHKAHPEIPSAK